nr:hypothetical protein [Caulobacter sp. 602-1]
MPQRPKPPAMMVMPSNNSPARASTASFFTLSTMVSPYSRARGLSRTGSACLSVADEKAASPHLFGSWRTVSPEPRKNSTLDELFSGRVA